MVKTGIVKTGQVGTGVVKTGIFLPAPSCSPLRSERFAPGHSKTDKRGEHPKVTASTAANDLGRTLSF